MMNSKKGISIIAVLLFMLIATIAGTATYRWLSSEGRSSASRMFQSEARMAAVAGIESARSWFANHGNDAGAVIKQVKNAKQKNKAVKLDNQLVAFKKDKQNYSVYVVDVDDSKQPYKVKVVSEGTSRDGSSKFSETAVLKISGLYRVAKPVRTSPIDFDANYFGGSTVLSQDNKAEAMIVNGDLTGNELTVERKLVVTGNVTNFTNKIGLADTNCIGGNLALSNQGLSSVGNVTYVGGNTSNFSVQSDGLVGGSYYFDGDFSVPTNEMGQPVVIGGNVTINGNYTGTSNGKKMTIKGDLCLGDESKMDFKNPTSLDKGGFVANGTVWIPKGDALSNSGVGNYQFVNLGGSDKNAYITNMGKCPSGGSYKVFDNGLALSESLMETFTSCPENLYYQASGSEQGCAVRYTSGDQNCEEGECVGLPTRPFNGVSCPWETWLRCTRYKCKIPTTLYPNYALFTTKASQGNPASATKPSCADDVKTFCTENYLNTSEKCPDGTTNKIDDLLSTASKYYGSDDYTSSCVNDKIIAADNNHLMNGGAIDRLNECYATSSNKLYNGFLVVKAGAAKFNVMFNSTGRKTLKGKFIFYVNENENSGTKFKGNLPPTEVMDSGDSSMVFMFLPNGGDEIYQGGGGSGKYRYFIYSLNDVTSIGSNGSGEWVGSFYFSAENCAKLNNFGSGDVQTVTFSKGMITDLSNSGILCNASDVDCGGTAGESGSGSSSGSSSDSESKDSIFVAVGASLLVELESQYKTTEKINSSEDVAPSVVVLPRVIYLNSDAEGELRDYFSPVRLNGAKVLGGGSLDCSDKKLEQSPLPDLDQNTNAVCTFSSRDDGNSYKSEFFVSIEGTASAIPKVGFDGDAAISWDLAEANTMTVVMNIGAVNNGSGEYEMDVVVKGNFDWISSAKTNTNFTLVSSTDAERRYHLKGNITANETTADLFDISTTSASSPGNIIFTIENPQNCRPMTQVKSITLRGAMKVVRGSLTEYCEKMENRDGDYCKEIVTAAFKQTPSCENWIKNNYGDNFEWVTASGDACSIYSDNGVLQTNNAWKCYMGTSINLVQKNSSSIEEYCSVYIPGPNNTITSFANNNDQPLYAEVKHKKYKLDVHLRNRGSGYALVYASTKGYPSLAAVLNAIDRKELSNPVECRNENCPSIDVYAGYHLYLLGKNSSSDRFSYWEHPSSVSGAANIRVDGNPFHIVVKSDTTAYGVFNDHDEHCFYDNFENTEIFCKSDSYNCIDRCSDDSKDANCSVTDGHQYANANWTMVYANTPQNCTEYGFGIDKLCQSWPTSDYGTCCRTEGYFKPLKKTNNGLYFRRGQTILKVSDENGLSGDNTNDGQESVILNRVDAGANGTLTASFFTEEVSYLVNNRFLNSGFILRSNADATEYLTLSVYGKNLTGLDIGAGYQLYARVCYVSADASNTKNKAKTLINTNSCSSEEEIKFGSLSVTKTMLNKLNVEATLQGDFLDVTVGVEQIVGSNSWITATKRFNLSQEPLRSLYSEEDPRYVGMKLSDDGFKIYDIAWRADGADCWDTPYASCSFAANYIGGRVPENQNVMPWVTTSTWLSDKVASGACNVTYFYNGCDMDDDLYQTSGSLFDLLNSWRETAKSWFNGVICREPSSTGLYWDDQDGNRDGAPLRTDAQYNFSYKGLHGEAVSPPKYAHTGIVRNASVRVTCDDMKRSYVANCGAFWVGEIKECSRNESIMPYEGPASGFEYFNSDAGVDKSFVLRNAINLRNASLVFSFAPDSDPATLYLKDEANRTSATIEISAANNIVAVNRLVDEFGFDPENVKELVFYSEGVFLITEINSLCANAPSATCSGASYSAEEGWKLNATATNGDECEMIVSDGFETKAATVVCGNNVMTPVVPSQATVLNDWAKGITTDTDFQVSLRVKKGEEYVTCSPAIPVTVSYAAPSPEPKPYVSSVAKSATCSKIDNGIYRVEVNGCDSYDNCSVKTRKNDDAPEIACNWVTYGCDVSLYYAGTYDVIFNDGTMDHRLAGCSGIVFSEEVNND